MRRDDWLRLLAGVWELRARILLVMIIVAVVFLLGWGTFRRASKLNLRAHNLVRP